MVQFIKVKDNAYFISRYINVDHIRYFRKIEDNCSRIVFRDIDRMDCDSVDVIETVDEILRQIN